MKKPRIFALTCLATGFLLAPTVSAENTTANQGVLSEQNMTDGTVIENRRHHFFNLSPNGQSAVHVEYQEGNAVIMIKTPSGTRRIKAGPMRLSELHWINDEQLVFASNGQLRLLNKDGSGYRVLLDTLHYQEDGKFKRVALYANHQKEWSVINPLHHQPNTILVGAKDVKKRAYVYELNTETGFLKTLADGKNNDVNEWVVSANGRIDFGINKERGEMTFLASADKHWQNFDTRNESLGLAFDGGSYLSRRTIFLGLSNQENIIYLSENIHTDRFRVVEYNLEEHRIQHILADDSRYDVGGDEHTKLVYDRYDGELAGIHYQTHRPETRWLDPELALLQLAIDKRYPTEVHRIKQWDEDKQSLLVESYDQAARATVYAVNSDSLNRLKLADLHSKGNNAAANQAVQFTSRDGYLLDGYLTVPTDAKGPSPLIVLPHGGPWSRDVWSYNEEAQFFAANGYATLTVNFRGSTGHGFRHIKEGVGELSGLMIDDIADAARWAINQGIAQNDHVYLLGTSYGGYAAIMGAVRYPELFKAISANAAPLDIAKQFKHYRKHDHDFAYNFWSEAVINPNSSKDALDAISPINYIADLETPYKLFHGAADAVVPVSHIKAAQKRVDDKHRIEIVEGEGHGFQSPTHRRNFLEESLNLFKSA